jgi:hypothetical protein
MTITLEELLTPKPLSEVETDVAAIMASANIPVTAWQSTGVYAGQINADASLWNEVNQKASTIAKFCLIEYSTGDICTAAAKQRYGLDREPARATIGTITAIATGAGGSFASGEFIVTSGDYSYSNIDPVNIDDTGTTFSVQCTVSGEGANRAGETLIAPTGYALNVTSGYDWITQLGLNEERDERLIMRCKAQALASAPSGPVEFYQYWALQTDPSITRVRVATKLYDVDGYHVQVRLGTDFGTASAAQVTAVDAVLQVKKPAGVLVYTTYATEATITLIGTVWGSTAQSVDENIRRLLRSHDPSLPIYDDEIIRAIGGSRASVYYAEGARYLTAGQQIAAKDVFSVINEIVVLP